MQQVRPVQSLQKLSAGVGQCGALSAGNAEVSQLEQLSLWGRQIGSVEANGHLSEAEALLPHVFGAR